MLFLNVLNRNVAFSLSRMDCVCVSGPDWYIPVPDTGRLDSSAHIARAQLAQKSKRHPPSRDKLRESFRKQVGDGAVKMTFSFLLLTVKLTHTHTHTHTHGRPCAAFRKKTLRNTRRAARCLLPQRSSGAAEVTCPAPRPSPPSALNLPPASSSPHPFTSTAQLLRHSHNPHPHPESPKGNFPTSGAGSPSLSYVVFFFVFFKDSATVKFCLFATVAD